MGDDEVIQVQDIARVARAAVDAQEDLHRARGGPPRGAKRGDVHPALLPAVLSGRGSSYLLRFVQPLYMELFAIKQQVPSDQTAGLPLLAGMELAIAARGG